jgi:excisionase family DNA binding protein
MSEILTTDQAAARLALGRSTLEKWRCSGTGPKFIRLGARRVGYDRADLDDWIAARPRRTSTSELDAPPGGPGRRRQQTVVPA